MEFVRLQSMTSTNQKERKNIERESEKEQPKIEHKRLFKYFG